jgi:hypothetical protein
MRLLKLFALSGLLVAGSASAQSIDFVSADGPARTCPRYLGLDPARLRGDADRVAYAICNTIDLTREAASRFRTYNERGERVDNTLVDDLRSRLEHILKRVHASRLALEGVKGAGPYFAIRPGEWAIDWNGDGSIDTTEKYLLWVPKRGRTEFRARPAFPSEAAYNEDNFSSPQIRVDRADIYWAAAYLQFFEAAVNLLLSYEVDFARGFEVRLKDGNRIAKVAYRDLLGGLRASAQLRQALLKETDDDDEWIPNPKQARSSFPLLMDAQTFATWGELLGHMEKLFRGQTLLGGTVDSQEFRGVRDLAGGICAPGEGIDVKSLFTDPIREPLRPDALKSRCRAPTKARPLTGLAAMIAESVRRNAGRTPASFSGEWMILRHFYWVN